jgi:hypothetical protein
MTVMARKLEEQGLRRVKLQPDMRIVERAVWRIEDRPREVREAAERAGIKVLALRPVDIVRPARGDEELFADEDGEVVAARVWRVETSWEEGFFPLYVEVLW